MHAAVLITLVKPVGYLVIVRENVRNTAKNVKSHDFKVTTFWIFEKNVKNVKNVEVITL